MSTYKRKRTRKPSQGIGDSIEKTTEATGIKAAVKFLAGEDCGCDQRKEKLNNLFPYRQPLCMTEEEYNWMTAFREAESTTITHEESETIAKMYHRIFQLKRIHRPCTCNPREWQRMINELNSVWETYGA